MEEKVIDMLRQVLSHAENASDFAVIRDMVDEAHRRARTQPEYWRVNLSGQERDVVFPDFGMPVLPMKVIVLNLDKENNEDTRGD